MPLIGEARRAAVAAAETAAEALASPAGRRARRRVAAVLVIATPVIFRIPLIRRNPWIRTVELLGGTVLVVKAAEWLRDWEPPTRLDT